MDNEFEFLAHVREADDAPQSLWQHLQETSQIAGDFAAEIDLRAAGALLGLLHDLGKASQQFQNYIGSAQGRIDPDSDDYVDYKEMKGKVDHSSAGAQYLYRQLSAQGAAGKLAAQVLSLCIASHHSGLIDCLSPEGEDKFTKRIEKPEEYTHQQEAFDRFLSQHQADLAPYFAQDRVITELVEKMKAQAEPLDGNDTRLFKIGLLIRFLLSCLIDADRLNTADFESPQRGKLRNAGNYVEWPALIQRLDNKLAAFVDDPAAERINAIRRQVSAACLSAASRPKGIYQLKVPTGGGKTLASLRFALNHAQRHALKRVIYVIPYTSIIDQNADEVRKILEDQDSAGNYSGKIVLEHHSNLTPEEATTRQGLLAENWDAPVVFTTQVQFLEALFGGGTRNLRRMHQMANSVLIFDEVQTIPVRFVHLFNLALRFLVHDCGASAVLCTATQPLLDRVLPPQRALRLADDAQLAPEAIFKSQPLRRTNIINAVKPGGWTAMEVAQLAVDESQAQGSTLVIVNTRDAARSLYSILAEMTQAKVYHLSTNMCPVHRLSVLAEIRQSLERKEQIICVSTQLIEAGVDIDFGAVIRYLAGFDSIIQAAGRCNRHGKRAGGNVYIVNPAEEKLDHLKDIQKGAEITQRLLHEFEADPDSFEHDLLSDKAITRFYEYYFYARQGEMGYPIPKSSQINREGTLFDLLAENGTAVSGYVRACGEKPAIPFKQSFLSAGKIFNVIDSFTRGVIIPYGDRGKQLIADLCGALPLEKQYRTLKEAQRYSVNLYQHELDELVKQDAIREVKQDSGVYCLDERYYSAEIGWCAEAVNPMSTLCF